MNAKKVEQIMNLEEIKKAISECNCLEIAGRVYMRNYDLNGRWQTKEALDYVAQGGENTYASWSDEQLATKLFNIVNN